MSNGKKMIPASPTQQNDAVLASLAESMTVELVVNEDSEVWVLHDRPLPGILEWVEYDADDNTLHLITNKGKIQPLGIVITELMAGWLKNSQYAAAFLMQHQKIQDMYVVPLTVRDTAIH